MISFGLNISKQKIQITNTSQHSTHVTLSLHLVRCYQLFNVNANGACQSVVQCCQILKREFPYSFIDFKQREFSFCINV